MSHIIIFDRLHFSLNSSNVNKVIISIVYAKRIIFFWAIILFFYEYDLFRNGLSTVRHLR